MAPFGRSAMSAPMGADEEEEAVVEATAPVQTSNKHKEDAAKGARAPAKSATTEANVATTMTDRSSTEPESAEPTTSSNKMSEVKPSGVSVHQTWNQAMEITELAFGKSDYLFFSSVIDYNSSKYNDEDNIGNETSGDIDDQSMGKQSKDNKNDKSHKDNKRNDRNSNGMKKKRKKKKKKRTRTHAAAHSQNTGNLAMQRKEAALAKSGGILYLPGTESSAEGKDHTESSQRPQLFLPGMVLLPSKFSMSSSAFLCTDVLPQCEIPSQEQQETPEVPGTSSPLGCWAISPTTDTEAAAPGADSSSRCTMEITDKDTNAGESEAIEMSFEFTSRRQKNFSEKYKRRWMSLFKRNANQKQTTANKSTTSAATTTTTTTPAPAPESSLSSSSEISQSSPSRSSGCALPLRFSKPTPSGRMKRGDPYKKVPNGSPSRPKKKSKNVGTLMSSKRIYVDLEELLEEERINKAKKRSPSMETAEHYLSSNVADYIDAGEMPSKLREAMKILDSKNENDDGDFVAIMSSLFANIDDESNSKPTKKNSNEDAGPSSDSRPQATRTVNATATPRHSGSKKKKKASKRSRGTTSGTPKICRQELFTILEEEDEMESASSAFCAQLNPSLSHEEEDDENNELMDSGKEKSHGKIRLTANEQSKGSAKQDDATHEKNAVIDYRQRESKLEIAVKEPERYSECVQIINEIDNLQSELDQIRREKEDLELILAAEDLNQQRKGSEMVIEGFESEENDGEEELVIRTISFTTSPWSTSMISYEVSEFDCHPSIEVQYLGKNCDEESVADASKTDALEYEEQGADASKTDALEYEEQGADASNTDALEYEEQRADASNTDALEYEDQGADASNTDTLEYEDQGADASNTEVLEFPEQRDNSRWEMERPSFSTGNEVDSNRTCEHPRQSFDRRKQISRRQTEVWTSGQSDLRPHRFPKHQSRQHTKRSSAITRQTSPAKKADLFGKNKKSESKTPVANSPKHQLRREEASEAKTNQGRSSGWRKAAVGQSRTTVSSTEDDEPLFDGVDDKNKKGRDGLGDIRNHMQKQVFEVSRRDAEQRMNFR